MKKVGQEAPSWHLEEFEKPLFIASYFGFMPIETPRIKDEDFEITSDCEPHPHYNAAEKAAFLRTYRERDLAAIPHPLAFSYKVDSSKNKSVRYALELVGFNAGIAEALLIRATLSVLLETGHKHLIVDINCIGDKESISTYEQELHNFIRRSGTELSPDTRKELKKDIFNLIKSPTPETEHLRQNIPSSIAFLSTQSRVYFKEVLEHIESLDVEFRLNPELVGHKNYCSHTVFAVKDAESENETTLAIGYCYNRLSKRFGYKKELPLAGANIFLDQSKHFKERSTEAVKKAYRPPRPKFYLVQLGREAKMRSLSIIELLRRERIAIHHVLGRDKITAQLSGAESLRVPYLIIIGQKEAIDNTATIRNVATRAQDTIPLSALPAFLKNIAL
jgi:histidyl-tRNA synthetase